MQKKYIVSQFIDESDVVSRLENYFDLLDDISVPEMAGEIFEVTIRRIGAVRKRYEVELDSSES